VTPGADMHGADMFSGVVGKAESAKVREGVRGPNLYIVVVDKLI
jgi:hypothetical protein